MSGSSRGTILILQGGDLTLTGEQHGTVVVERGGRLIVERQGEIHGTISVGDGAQARIFGECHGTFSVDAGGAVTIEAGGEIFGTTTVDGDLINRGKRAGITSGRGHIDDSQGRVIRPTTTHSQDGVTIHTYE